MGYEATMQPLATLDLATITPERANQLWESMKRGGVDDFTAEDPRIFAQRLIAPNTACFEHPCGLAILSSIYPRLGAEIHFLAWDGVEESEMIVFGRQVVAYAFDTYELERLTATPPKFNRMAARVAQALGFEYEGCVRHAFLYHGKYHDVSIYGMLRSEYEEGA